MPQTKEHNQVVREEFTRQATAYAAPLAQGMWPWDLRLWPVRLSGLTSLRRR